MVGDVEQARGVLGALEVAAGPEEIFGVSREHQAVSSSRASTQVSFEPPPCEEFTTSEPRAQRHPREPARDHLDPLAREHERAQVDVAALEARAAGATPASIRVGCRESDTSSCAM